MTRPLRGGEVKAGPLRKKVINTKPLKKKLDGGGVKAWPLAEELFCGFPMCPY